MITSKELLERTGISRATLNNYISLGILERPRVLPSSKADTEAPRIGFFPEQAVTIIDDVQRLKKQGLTMSEIAQKFRKESGTATTETSSDSIPTSLMSYIRSKTDQNKRSTLSVELSVESIPGPAYLVNNNFELIWWNEAASCKLLNSKAGDLGKDISDRNLISLLMKSEYSRNIGDFNGLLSVHISAAKKRMPRTTLAKLYPELENEDVQLLEEIYQSTEVPEEKTISHYPLELMDDEGREQAHNIYVSYFREGIFFTCLPAETDSSSILELLSHRNQVIRDLMKKRRPFLTNLVAMVADLQNSVQICTELPPEEYFELINHIWQASEPIFRKYYGTHGKHVGDGMVYYFFPQPDCNYILNSLNCAFELKKLMRDITRSWQTRKNWLHELHLNIGLTEGQEWFGTYHSSTNVEFTVLGDTINFAARISDFARSGSIWTTKSMLSSLSPKQREGVRFGIRRRTESGEEVFVSDLYSRINSLIDLNEGKNHKFLDIAALPITEVIDVTAKLK
jgi:class 3 adenylate cyclase/DNA-binding transcriptional MerR regulator